MSDDGSGADTSDGGSGSDIGTDDTMRSRAGERGPVLWFLLDASRFLVLSVLSLAVFAAFVAAGVLTEPSLQEKLTSADTVETVFSAMIGVLVTGTTLVVTINQIILSQENGPLGDQRRRMSDALDFRDYTGELLGGVAPADPSAFLRGLVEQTERRAAALQRLVAENDDRELREQVDEFVDSLRSNADAVSDQLEGAQFGTYDVLSAALDYNYSWKVYQVDRMSDEFASSLDEDERTAFAELKTALAMFGPAREHVKTLYFQWALVDLSQYILYAAVPALVVAGCMLTFVGGGSFPGTTLGVEDITWVVGAAFTVTTVPFLLFTSYILRIATVAKRTLAIDPLILRESQR
jgi:hypothetical protein